VVPTLVHDGNVIVESTVIMHYLDDTFLEPPLMPHHPLDRTRAHLFKKLMDEYIHPSCLYRFHLRHRQPRAARQPLERAARRPTRQGAAAAPAEYKRAAVEEGLGSPIGKEATQNFGKLLKWNSGVYGAEPMARRTRFLARRYRRDSLHGPARNA
jgi:glutathione S-transferase